MVKLTRNTSNSEEIDTISNKVICYVEEQSIDSILGPSKVWKGQTEDEYFILMYVNGMLSLCINEREMKIADATIAIGMTPELREAVEASKMNREEGLKLTKEYMDSGKMSTDLKNITLNDTLEVLGWKIKDGAKIYLE